jgi:hypothetical protein
MIRDLSHLAAMKIHPKFLGFLMIEVVRQNPGDQQTLLTVLPYISEGFRMASEVKTASLVAMAEICCRKTLSAEYSGAFVSEVISHLKDDDTQEQLKASLSTVLIILQYQKVQALSSSDLSNLEVFNLTKLLKSLKALNETFDLSPFMQVAAKTYIARETG